MNKYDADHAAEWMEMHPYGWYNDEDDKGTGDEDDDYDEVTDDYETMEPEEFLEKYL